VRRLRRKMRTDLCTPPLPLATSCPPLAISFPLSLAPASSSAAVAESPAAGVGDQGGELEAAEAEGLARFRHILSSMRIKDWGLF
jgi:hypothetical protein